MVYCVKKTPTSDSTLLTNYINMLDKYVLYTVNDKHTHHDTIINIIARVCKHLLKRDTQPIHNHNKLCILLHKHCMAVYRVSEMCYSPVF